MIPEVDEILRGHAFFARRHKLPAAHESSVLAARKLALTLSRERPYDEPGAVLYAFTLVRHAFPGAWREMALRLAKNQAGMAGKVLPTDPDTTALIVSVSQGETSYEQVCLWMAMRLKSVY